MTEIIKNISIIVASITAIYAIASWRREHVGKRKIDLAEEVLCAIYEIKDVIRFIRSPFGFVGEGSTRKKADHETPDESKILDNAYVVYERYNQQKDVFNNFHKLEYRYMANFGKDAEKPFKIIREVLNAIFVASRMLGTVYWKDRDRWHISEAETSRRLEEIQKNEKVFWEIDPNDDINKKIEDAIKICESICKSANNLGLWNFVKKYR